MRALISVSDKTGIIEFAKTLDQMGYEIISTGGTYKLLKENEINAIPIDTITGFPEMMDGRVKTLHPNIHGGLLALRENSEHMAACKEYRITPIDLVIVNLYPFEATISKENVSLGEAIENIDIGGPSMIRSAAKNHQSVAVVVNPNRYSALIAELTNTNEISTESKKQLALEAFQHTANYDRIIADYLHKQYAETDNTAAENITLKLEKVNDLRYGENPHQDAAFYNFPPKTGLANIKQCHGKALSYNNIIDLEAAWLIAREFKSPTVAIVKHTNPCGAAVADTALAAYQKALEADPVSAFGSIIAINQAVDKALAEVMSSLFIEAIIAPQFHPDALEILMKKPALRLIEHPEFNAPLTNTYRHVQGGFLCQSVDDIVVKKDSMENVTTKKASPSELDDLIMAYTICKHVKSNAIVIAKDGQTIGIGAGQMSRVEAVEIAIKKAGDKVKGAVLASDAFFPFRDSVDLAASAGISAIIQPGGSKRDEESITACDENGISMLMTGIRHFKH